MKVIVYTRPDGGMSVFNPAPNARLQGEDDDTFLRRVQARAVPADATNIQFVEPSAIPPDRTFRNAWEQRGLALGVNMPKARALHREHLARRNITVDAAIESAIASAQTPDDLKAVAASIGNQPRASGRS